MTNLNNFICTNPFKYTEITVNGQHMCCNEWMPLDIKLTDNFKDNWNSDLAESARQSMLDGSFRYCSIEKCPHLNKVVHKNEPSGPVIRKTNKVVEELLSIQLPDSMKVVFDDTCNLACPSCRIDFIKNSSFKTAKSDMIFDNITKSYGSSLKFISMSGYGDPFYSTSLFNWLQNFNKEEYPCLENIHLHTNAMLWNTYNWDKIKNVHSFIKSAEISIDAAQADTYNLVRKGGKWDLLIKNLKFINTISNLESIYVSFVVQNSNVSEIVDFYTLMNSIFNKDRKIYFQYYKILNWGIMDIESFNNAAVWKPTHINYPLLVQQIEKLNSFNDQRIIHSFHGIKRTNTI